MIEIEVTSKFALRREDTGELQMFLPGRHLVEPEIAAHWYVKAHLKDAPPPEPKPGTPEFALRAIERANKAKAAAEAAHRALEEAEAAAQQAARSINEATAVSKPQERPRKKPIAAQAH